MQNSAFGVNEYRVNMRSAVCTVLHNQHIGHERCHIRYTTVFSPLRLLSQCWQEKYTEKGDSDGMGNVASAEDTDREDESPHG